MLHLLPRTEERIHPLIIFPEKLWFLLGCLPSASIRVIQMVKSPKNILSLFRWFQSPVLPLCWGLSSPGNLSIKETDQPSAEQHVQNTRFSDLGQSLSWYQRMLASCRGLVGAVCFLRYFPRASVLQCTPKGFSQVPLGYRRLPAVSALFSAEYWLMINKWGSGGGQYFPVKCSKTVFRRQAHAPQS